MDELNRRRRRAWTLAVTGLVLAAVVWMLMISGY